MKTDVTNKISRSIHKIGFKMKKHSPEILLVTGLIGTAATVVLACKSTLKVSEIVDEAKDTINTIHEGVATEHHTADGELYTQEDANRDLAITYIQTGWKLTKLYAPAIAVGALSVTCILASNNIMRKRNVALAAAFTAVDTSFKEYRNRLIERFGENGKALDRELRYNIKSEQVEERVVDENGNETTVTHNIEVIDPNTTHSIYSIIWDDGNRGWSKNAELNKCFLIQQQEAATYRLQRQGILTLNEVYEMLGAPRTKYGQIAGWVYTDDCSAGDNFVDFGIFDIHKPGSRDFVNLREKTIVLDFNCIGNILPHM